MSYEVPEFVFFTESLTNFSYFTMGQEVSKF